MADATYDEGESLHHGVISSGLLKMATSIDRAAVAIQEVHPMNEGAADTMKLRLTGFMIGVSVAILGMCVFFFCLIVRWLRKRAQWRGYKKALAREFDAPRDLDDEPDDEELGNLETVGGKVRASVLCSPSAAA
eukprot:4101880-Prymnesium_polylepis.1